MGARAFESRARGPRHARALASATQAIVKAIGLGDATLRRTSEEVWGSEVSWHESGARRALLARALAPVILMGGTPMLRFH